jgi:hypothetical protein
MKIICVGVGGIGSYFAQHVDRLIDSNQIKDTKFIFFDDDTVEKKNILYQNFLSKDIGKKKTTALEFRFLNLSFISKRVSFSDLTGYSLIILCADNNLIRRTVAEYSLATGVPFIDARANGRTVGIFSSNTENYLNTIDSSSEGKSCQNPFQIENNEIEFGNVIIAAILAQTVLNFLRYKKLPNDFISNF